MGATRRARSVIVVFIRGASSAAIRARDMRAERQSTAGRDEVSTSANDGPVTATDDVDGPSGGRGGRAYRARRTMGRTGLAAFARRRATTEKPARRNIVSVPRYRFADVVRWPGNTSTG